MMMFETSKHVLKIEKRCCVFKNIFDCQIVWLDFLFTASKPHFFDRCRRCNLSGNFLCAKTFWGKFLSPPQLAFVTVAFSCCDDIYDCDTLSVLRLAVTQSYCIRQKTSKCKSEGNFTYQKTPGDPWNPGLIRAKCKDFELSSIYKAK